MAHKPLQQWVTELSEHDLPLLKHSCEDLKQLGSYESVSMAKFSNIALTDPGLTLTVLRAACAMPRSRLQDEIHTVDTAAMKLGSGKLKATIAAMGFLEDSVNEDSKTVYLQLVSRAYHSAYQAYGMARERVDMAPEELFTAAMLHDLGALMLLVHGDGILLGFDNLDDVEEQRSRLGFTLLELSHALAKTWKLSSFIAQSLESYDGESPISPRLYEIHLAHDLSLAAQRGWETPEMEALIEKLAQHLHCDPEDALLEVRDNAIHSAEETTFYGVVPPAATLPDLDEDVRRSFIKGTATPDKTILKGCKTEIPAASLAPEEPFSPLNEAVLDEVIQQAKAQLAGEFKLPEFMALLKRGLVDGLKLNRAFFAMLDKERKYLLSRFMFGNEAGLRNLRIPLQGHNLFQRLLDKPQALRCQADNVQKIVPLLPTEFYKLINTDQFFVMTICARGKPLGVIYADRYGNDYGLDQADYEKLCQLGRLLGKGFERLGG
jgi:HD-like signal output (HDOD) protein